MFDELASAIEGLDVASSTRALRHILSLADRLHAKVAAAVAAVDTAGLHQVDGCGTMTTWLVVNARMSRPAAGALAARARRLAALPALHEAAQAGQLSPCQADTAARTIDPPVRDAFASHAAEIVPLWAPLPVKELACVAREWNARALAADGREEAPLPEPAGVTFEAYGTDGWHGTIDLVGLDGETVAAALDLASDAAPPAPGEPSRTVAQRRGDALVDICRFYLDHGKRHPEPAKGADGRRPRRRRRQRPHLNLVSAVGDAVDGGPARSLLTGRAVGNHDLLLAACDCTLHRVLVGTDSVVLDYGRGQRVVPDDLYQLLVVRDQHCRWPGCDRPPEWCDAHHVLHWLQHGLTSDTNCVLLCRRHHRQLHRPGYGARLATDGTLTITTPAGDTYTTAPALRRQLVTNRAGP